jgi:pilus assembly protein CpaB
MKRLLQSRIIRLSSVWLLAISSAALAVITGRAYLDEQIEIERTKLVAGSDKKTAVVVAKFELQRGDVIDASSMAVREVPAQYVSSSVISPDRFDSVAGSRLGRSMRSGEPLLLEYLKVENDLAGLSHRLKPGSRAVTIHVDEVNALSGMLQPGDRIDLLMSARGSEAASRAGVNRELTIPLMQDVLVLATGKQVGQTPDTDNKGRIFTSITMELTPDQAQRLVTAQRGGRLTAMLRGQGDRVSYRSKPIDIDQILGVASVTQSATRIEPIRTELIIGGNGALSSGITTRTAHPQSVGTESNPASASPLPEPVLRSGSGNERKLAAAAGLQPSLNTGSPGRPEHGRLAPQHETSKRLGASGDASTGPILIR